MPQRDDNITSAMEHIRDLAGELERETNPRKQRAIGEQLRDASNRLRQARQYPSMSHKEIVYLRLPSASTVTSADNGIVTVPCT